MSERNLIRRFGVGIVCLAGSTFLASSAADAAGNGYGPTAPPSAVAAGFTSVVEAQSITPAGGSVTGSYAGETFAITIPARALQQTEEVVITAPDLKTLNVVRNSTAVAGIGVAFISPRTGRKYGEAPSRPVTLTITDAAISGGDTVVSIVGQDQFNAYGAATVAPGRAVITLGGDANIAIVESSHAGGPPPRQGSGHPPGQRSGNPRGPGRDSGHRHSHGH
jgi:hypothetical protein